MATGTAKDHEGHTQTVTESSRGRWIVRECRCSCGVWLWTTETQAR